MVCWTETGRQYINIILLNKVVLDCIHKVTFIYVNLPLWNSSAAWDVAFCVVQ